MSRNEAETTPCGRSVPAPLDAHRARSVERRQFLLGQVASRWRRWCRRWRTWQTRRLRLLRFSVRNMDRLRKCVAHALGRDARYFGGRQVDNSALVRIERTKLLIDGRVARFLSEIFRHLPKLDVLALAI